jgi:hypothetical protein
LLFGRGLQAVSETKWDFRAAMILPQLNVGVASAPPERNSGIKLRAAVMVVYKKTDIALEFLDMAMELFVQQRSYFAAIHLAAAAEELLGKLLPKEERISEIAIKAQIAFQVDNDRKEIDYDTAQKTERKAAAKVDAGLKNTIKHVNDGNDLEVEGDPVSEASYFIEHALINLESLKMEKPRSCSRYAAFTNSNS